MQVKRNKNRPFIRSAIDPIYRGVRRRRPFKLIVLAEVFLRDHMGKRYFTVRIFFQGLCLLLILRLLLIFWEPQAGVVEQVVFRFIPFDIFLGGYGLLGLLQFIQQQARRISNVPHHSEHIGNSRLMILGKLFLYILNTILYIPLKVFSLFLPASSRPAKLGYQDVQYATYVIVEPVVVLCFALYLFSQSWLFFAFIGVMMSLSLFRYNRESFRADEEEYWNYEDNGQDIERIQDQFQIEMQPIDSNRHRQKNVQPEISKKPTKKIQITKEKIPDDAASPDAEDLFRSLDPKLKNLGRKRE